MPLVLVCFMIWGTPLAAILMWDSILQHIRHHLKTGYGITDEFYEYSKQSLIIGSDQGSKAGSPTCSTLTLLLLQAMDVLATELLFYSPDKSLQYSTKSIVFSNDNININNNLLQWIQQPSSADTVLQQIQHDSQTWEQWLYTLGFKLKLIKYKYNMMIWQFNGEGKAELIPVNKLPTMLLTSGTEPTQHKMTQMDCSTAHKP